MTVAPIHQLHQQSNRQLSVDSHAKASEKHVTVAVRGEVDACNAKDFAIAVCEAIVDAERVTLDLSQLEFIAFDGVAALHAVNAHLTRADVPWCVVPGAAVSRVLGLCDPEQVIPLARPNHRSRRSRASLRLVEPA